MLPRKMIVIVLVVSLSIWITEAGKGKAKEKEKNSKEKNSKEKSGSAEKKLEKELKELEKNIDKEAKEAVKAMKKKEHRLAKKTKGKRMKGPGRILALLAGCTEEAKTASEAYMKTLEILKIVQNRNKMNKKEMEKFLEHFNGLKKAHSKGCRGYNCDRRNSNLGDEIGKDTGAPRCLHDAINVNCTQYNKYRSIDGSCNNLKYPYWGRSNIPYLRWLPAEYEDFIDEPRGGYNFSRLPSARKVSQIVMSDKDKTSVFSMAVMTLGQVLDHDIDKTAVTKNRDESDALVDVDCGDDNCDIEDKSCFPILIDIDNDPCYKKTRCLKLVRSAPSTNADCDDGPREQINQVSSYLDSSIVYGSTVKGFEDLRDKIDKRKLLMREHPFQKHVRKLLPPVEFPACVGTNETIKCCKAGDGRVNEWVGLAVFHTLFAREHNRIADIFSQLNPHWDNEKVFQETRRLVVAIWQRIIYGEYLPIILGEEFSEYDLQLKTNNDDSIWYHEYDARKNAGAHNVFQGAAFRFGHSQIGEFVRLMKDNYKGKNDRFITKTQNRPKVMYQKDGIDDVTRGHLHLPAQNTDAHMTKQMTCHMFTATPPFGEGTDLAAINTQRGRDHGIPGYNKWRTFCGLTAIKDWNHKPKEMPIDAWENMKEVYDDVEDIDIFPAGIAEETVPGGAVGKTFACLIGKQFELLRRGDRFWHENPSHEHPSRGEPYYGGFTEGQLRTLQRSSLSRIMCDNSDGITSIQPRAMLLPRSEIPSVSESVAETYGYSETNTNERIPCDNIPAINFEEWRESP